MNAIRPVRMEARKAGGPVDPPTPEWMPTNTLNKQVARARRQMGEKRWQELNAEWDA